MDIIESIMMISSFIFMTLGYFAPFVVAIAGQHKNAVDIFWLNLLIGWTVFGWILLIMEAKNEKGATTHRQ